MALLSPCWVPLKRVLKMPNVLRVYKRAGRGQGTGQGIIATHPSRGTLISARKGFLRTVQIFLQGETLLAAGGVTDAGASWIRKCPGGSNDIMDCQIDVTNIPGVPALRKDGTWGLASE
jgi:hypothetical protein